MNPHYTSIRIDFILTLSDGTQLDCTKFIPEGNPPQGGWPAVILTHGYGLSKYDVMDDAEELAEIGFYSLVYSVRGQGASGGQSNLISRTEMNDLMQVVQFAKNEPVTNDNRIAVQGGSQGGILSLMAACNGMNVRTVISDLSSPEFASSWIENGSIKMTLLWTVSYSSNTVRYNSLVGRFRSWILSGQRDKWDSLAYYIPQNRDFISQLQNCQMPVLLSNAWQDKFFNTLGVIRSAYILPYNNYRMYCGTLGSHGSDYDNDEIMFHDDLISDWHDYWLYSIQNNVMDVSRKFSYASSRYPLNQGSWTWDRFYSPVWPPSGVNTVRLYFHPQNQLLTVPYSGSTTSVDFLNNVLDTTLTMLEAVNYEFTGPVFYSRFRKESVVFETPPLLQDATMAGTPKLGLFYSSNANICQYNFQVWDVMPNGSSKLVTRINWTDRYYSPNSLRSRLADGQAYSHVFRQGDRIRVVATNLDNTADDQFLRTNPHVLPVLKRAVNKVYINGSFQSYIDLPMKNFAIGIRPISSSVPEEHKLFQNYPNPFNPVTNFELRIANLSHIRVAVFDAAGSLVETLVNERMKPGAYRISFDASGLSSGVYFYTLESDGVRVDSKKMVVVK